MKVTYYLKRIINDKIKLVFMFLLILLPMADLLSKLIHISHGATPMAPWSSTFLSLTSTSSFAGHEQLSHQETLSFPFSVAPYHREQ